ncbi:MAG: 8-oxo-dGTP pyrophosphatase MutT (NUDIX family), partial [Candidatus Azotimanducaceae bacterium]
MSILKIDSIVSRLDGHKRDLEEIGEGTREAAVATILRPGNQTEAMFILRASRDGDPWSGQMAFPGGHRDPGDLSIRHTAERETWEEVGLDLSSHAHHLGELDQIRVRPRGRNIDMVVTPVLYVLKSEPFVLNPNDEVAEILWG